MVRIGKEAVDVKMSIPGAVLRQRENFGQAGNFGRISAEYFTLAEGVDTAPLFEDLDGSSCQCPHWGFLLRGQLTVTDTAGGVETVNAHDLFYWPPGHNVHVDRDAEIVMFSPQREHTFVIDHMIRKVSQASPSA